MGFWKGFREKVVGCLLYTSLFKYIPAIETALKKKPKEVEKEVVEAPVVEEISEEQDMTDDTELVAVIAAAIAAAEGTTTDGFVVRSIRTVSYTHLPCIYGLFRLSSGCDR